MSRQDKPRRVLVVHPGAELYGSDRIALESSVALQEAGWQVTTALATDGPLVSLLEAAGVATVVVPTPVLRKAYLSPLGIVRLLAAVLAATPAMVRTLRSTRPDLVCVNTITIPWWILLARLLGKRVVGHLHEAEADVPKPVRLALAAPFLLTHRVVANSEFSRDLVVRDLPRLEARMRVVYNGVAGPPGEPAPPRAELAEPVRLVLVGRISPRKGTDTAVEALGLLVARGRDVTLDLVGGVFPGYEWFEQSVRDHAEARDIGTRLRWRGELADIWPALADADIVLVPSRVEPFGNAAVEAMLAARPVIAGATQGLREIVRPGENGHLVTPGDSEQLAAAVERLVDDWPHAGALAAAGRADALRRFSRERYRQEFAAVVTESGLRSVD